ncbi:dockerin, partial [Candidatus Magnetomorum sp. HK-1]
IASDYLSANDADNDSLTYSIVEQSTKGSVTLVDANSGQFQYTPNPGAVGIDIFYFKVNDGLLDSNKASVEITIEKKEPELCETSMTVPSKKEVSYNSVFTFPISISQSCLSEGIDLYINYDSDLLSLSDKIASLNDDILKNYQLTINSNEPGELMISIFGNSDLVSANGNFVNIEFIASGKSSDNATITLSKAFSNKQEIDTSNAIMNIEIR